MTMDAIGTLSTRMGTVATQTIPTGNHARVSTVGFSGACRRCGWFLGRLVVGCFRLVSDALAAAFSLASWIGHRRHYSTNLNHCFVHTVIIMIVVFVVHINIIIIMVIVGKSILVFLV